jgi:hypothetical protein
LSFTVSFFLSHSFLPPIFSFFSNLFLCVLSIMQSLLSFQFYLQVSNGQ